MITLFEYSNTLLLNVFVEMLILQYGTTQMSNCLRFREYEKVSDVEFWSKCEEKEKTQSPKGITENGCHKRYIKSTYTQICKDLGDLKTLSIWHYNINVVRKVLYQLFWFHLSICFITVSQQLEFALIHQIQEPA